MNRELTLIIAAKDLASGALGKLGGGLDRLRGATGGVATGFANAGGAILKTGAIAGAAMAAGIGALVAGLLEAAKAAAAEEVGITRLGSALSANVPNWDGNTAAIERRIAAGGRLAFDDSDLRDSLSKLVPRTHDVNEAFRLQALAMDLARARGISLGTATDIVGKVYSGNTGILSRYGIAVDKGATATQALAAIQASTAGQAEAYGRTTTGAYQGLQIVLGNLVEDIGTSVTPILVGIATLLQTTLIPAIQSAAAGFQQWVTDNQPLIDQIQNLVANVLTGLVTFITTTLIPGVAGLFGTMGAWVTANQPLIDQLTAFGNTVLTAVSTAIGTLTQNLNIVVPFIAGPLIVALGAWALSAGAAAAATLAALAPLAAVAAAIGLLAVAWSENWGGIRDIVDGVVKAVQPWLETVLVPAIQKVQTFLQNLADLFSKFFDTIIAPALTGVLEGLRGVWEDVIAPAIGVVFDALGPLADLFSKLFDTILAPAIDGVLSLMRGALDLVGQAIQGLQKIVDGIVGPLRDLLGVVQDIVQGFLDMIGLSKKAPTAKEFSQPTVPFAGQQPVLHGGNRQHGGVVLAGRSYTVGEHGIEVFTPGVSGRVQPTAGTAIYVGGITVTVQGGGASAEAIANDTVLALQRKLRQQRLSLA